ncbi:MAG TPA: hypothetical protein VKD88_02765 [Gaiellaceae bacterium]|nr:hypothetical protein [Gaiellaceae bacterium]
MRRLVWLTALLVCLAVPAAAFAFGSDDGTLSVKSGVGKVYLNFNGSAVGRVRTGSIRVVDPVTSDGVGFEFSNCDVVVDKSDTTTNTNDKIKVCRGDNIRFRAIGGNYRIQIAGAGVNLSAVGHGSFSLNGAGDADPFNPSTFDGTYSLNDGPYKSLPNAFTTFALATPPSGP